MDGKVIDWHSQLTITKINQKLIKKKLNFLESSDFQQLPRLLGQSQRRDRYLFSHILYHKIIHLLVNMSKCLCLTTLSCLQCTCKAFIPSQVSLRRRVYSLSEGILLQIQYNTDTTGWSVKALCLFHLTCNYHKTMFCLWKCCTCFYVWIV